MAQFKPRAKLLVVGDGKVGKTSFIKKFLNQHEEIKEKKKTLTTDLYKRDWITSDGKELSLKIFDIYAGERDTTLSKMVTRNVKACFIIIDVMDNGWRDSVDKWIIALEKDEVICNAFICIFVKLINLIL